jgi:diketogulonate reductase-like aldo/keto reductase
VGIPSWLKAGGTGIDTALDYGDQTVINSILKGLKTPRSAYFMTSKITTHGTKGPFTAEYALNTVKEDIKQLGIERLDIVLIHHPVLGAGGAAQNSALWKGLEQAVAMNLTRTIGLSNFNQAQITSLLKTAKIRPTLNQCDLSVGGQDAQCGPRDAAIAFNQAQNITYEAWVSLGCAFRPCVSAQLCSPPPPHFLFRLCANKRRKIWTQSPMKHCPFTDPTMTKIAAAHDKVSVAQVCLRWILVSPLQPNLRWDLEHFFCDRAMVLGVQDRGCTIAVGTGSDAAKAAEYAKENLDLFGFKLSAAEVKEIDALAKPDSI